MKLYGIKEIAEAVNKSPNLIKQWHLRGKLPQPSARLGMGPVWSARVIEPWIRSQKTESESR